MTDYTKVNDFAAKDLTKAPVVGAEFQQEFNAVQTAVNSKADKTNAQLENPIRLDPISVDDNSTGLATTQHVKNAIDQFSHTKDEPITTDGLFVNGDATFFNYSYRFTNEDQFLSNSDSFVLQINGAVPPNFAEVNRLRLTKDAMNTSKDFAAGGRVTGKGFTATASSSLRDVTILGDLSVSGNFQPPRRTTLFTGTQGAGDVNLSQPYTNFDYLEVYLGTSDSLGGHVVSVESIEYARSISKDYEFTAGRDLFWRIRPDTNRSRFRHINDSGVLYRVVGIKY